MSKLPYDEETRRALKLFVVLSRCYNSVMEHSRQDIARHDLSSSEFAVMELLFHKGPTPLGAIAEQVLLATGSITYIIDQLDKQGYVERIPCPTDRRVYHAGLTAAGRACIERIFPEHAERIRVAMQGLSWEEQEEALRLFKQLGLAAEEALRRDGKAG